MKIGIIGAGFCGLTAAYELSKKGHRVVVFEKEEYPGGLASSFEISSGITIERFIHHIFQSDKEIISLVDELGLSSKLNFYQSKDGVFYNEKVYPFASGFDLLAFSPLSILDRLRFGIVTLYLKQTKNWKKFEQIIAEDWIKQWFGEKSFDVVWGPLLKSKFGRFADQISMSWFWARVYCRTPKLGYFEGGFSKIADTLVEKIQKNQGEMKFAVSVDSIQSQGDKINLQTTKGNFLFDKVIVTVPAPIFAKITPDLAKNYRQQIENKKFLTVCNLLLVLKKSLMPFYWLNINDASFPFVVAAEQTNLVPKSWYQNKIILNFGDYLEENDQKFTFTKEEALKHYLPYLKRINPQFSQDWVESAYFFQAPFAQQVVDVKYSKTIPEIKTPIKNLYLATMAQVYPYDRGVNYAVKLGKEAAAMVDEKED